MSIIIEYNKFNKTLIHHKTADRILTIVPLCQNLLKGNRAISYRVKLL